MGAVNRALTSIFVARTAAGDGRPVDPCHDDNVGAGLARPGEGDKAGVANPNGGGRPRPSWTHGPWGGIDGPSESLDGL